jgi:adenine-specific DNA-methyltransferase
MRRLIDIGCGSSGIVLDFFAGSSSMAHAVFLANVADGGSRRFIMVQLDEKPDPKSEAAKAGYTTISALSRERIRRAGSRIAEDAGLMRDGLDLGFRALRVDTTNLSDVLRTPDLTTQDELTLYTDSVKADRTGEDLLFQVLLDWGLELTMPIRSETVEGQEIFDVEDGALVACFSDQVNSKVVSAIAERQPLRAVFLDSGFAMDADRINAEQVFAERSPATDVKTI